MDGGYEHLRPSPGDLPESFEVYRARVSPLLPGWPDEVLLQWLFQHFAVVVARYGWLDFGTLSFAREVWPVQRILSSVRAFNEAAVESWKTLLFADADFYDSPLGTFMIEHGTWPVAPVVIDNAACFGMPDGKAIHRWELIEGHHRLAYLRALAERDQVQATHALWLVTPGTRQ